jgi:hypothetical protein
MCTSVGFRQHIYTTPRQIGKLVGGLDRVVFRDGYEKNDSRIWDYCTCSVNIPRTFKAAGFSVVDDEDGDPMRYIVEKELSKAELKKMRKGGVKV